MSNYFKNKEELDKIGGNTTAWKEERDNRENDICNICGEFLHNCMCEDLDELEKEGGDK